MSEHFQPGHAIIIGAGADLPNTVDDAQGLADILRDPERCAYPPAQVHLLTGAQARRANLLAALDNLAKATTTESTVVVYFSGHGCQVTSPTGEFYYLLPYGYDLQQLYQTAISGAELVGKLAAIPARKMLVLLDCCHAGGVGESKTAGLQLAKAPLPPEAGDLLAQGRGRVLIASSRADELSFAGKPYSAFTLALIEALCGEGASKRDGYVRVADLALHTREKVPQRTKDRQHPLLHFEQADNFVVAYYSGGDSQPKGVPFTTPPEIEPEPGAWTRFDQRGQTVHGPQTNIAGDVHGPVLSGQFQAPVQVGDITTGDVSGTGIAIGHGAKATVTQGSAADPIAQAFKAIAEKIDALPDGKTKDDARDAAQKLEAEARSGEQADESRVRRWFTFLAETAPDAWDVALATFVNPIAGVGKVFQLVAARAKDDRAKKLRNDA